MNLYPSGVSLAEGSKGLTRTRLKASNAPDAMGLEYLLHKSAHFCSVDEVSWHLRYKGCQLAAKKPQIGAHRLPASIGDPHGQRQELPPPVGQELLCV